jgi:putative hydrolase of the HAD superfamily
MNFIFDMGNVLSLNVDVIPIIVAELGIDLQDFMDFSGEDFYELSVGKMQPEEYWRAFNRRFDTDVREDLLITRFHPVIDEKVKGLILELKDAGHRVVCGTNTFEKHYQRHLERGDYSVFEKVYASHIMGIAKPSAAFFEYILEKESWPARETLFIDDLLPNVKAASGVGITGIHYVSFETLKEKLREELGAKKTAPPRISPRDPRNPSAALNRKSSRGCREFPDRRSS